MTRIDTGLFIARRISVSAGGRPGVMTRIATFTVATSVAVMIVALAVIAGFRHEITSRLAAFGGHVEVVSLDGNSSLETRPIRRDAALERAIRECPGFGSIYPYAVKGAIVKTDGAMQGVMLKGVDEAFDWGFFEARLAAGTLPRVGGEERTKDMIISVRLADLLAIGVDDRVEMLFVQEGQPPRRDAFRITGLYNTGLVEMDMIAVLTDIRNVARLNGWTADEITGYGVNCTDPDRVDEFAESVYAVAADHVAAQENGLMVIGIRERFPNLFDWLAAHRVNGAVIVVIMTLVALLNMICALLIILLERTRMIGVLKALGMGDHALQRMFLVRSGFIILKGLVWGNVAGIGLCLLQRWGHVVKLDEAGYFLSEVPVRLGVWWIAALDAGCVVVILALLAIPTGVVARVRPERTIRFQ